MTREAEILGSDGTPRVVYIAGAGHSGSTFLDIMLGQSTAIEGVGELVNLQRARTAGEYCACGAPVAACPFWCQVERDWVARVGEAAVRELPELQGRFERLSSFPRLLWEAHNPSPAFLAYGRTVAALFAAIRGVSRKPVIVDSSKYPSRALALSLIGGIDVRVLHLVRDVRAVAWSLRRASRRDLPAGVARTRLPRPVARTALFWLVTNVLADAACRRVGRDRSLRVRYEDLIARPLASLRAIDGFIPEGLSAVDAVFSGAGAVPHHTVAGNRMRMVQHVQLQPDVEWRRRMPAGQRLTAWLIAGGLMRGYGYAWDERDGSPAAVPPHGELAHDRHPGGPGTDVSIDGATR
jgi:hypothetical protein